MARKPKNRKSSQKSKPKQQPQRKQATAVPLPKRRDSVEICNVTPQVEGGRHPAYRVVGELLRVEADIFKDGHDVISAILGWYAVNDQKRQETPMQALDNDRWFAECRFEEIGAYRFEITAWMDEFLTWRHDFQRRVDGGQESLATETIEGVQLFEKNAARAEAADHKNDAAALRKAGNALAAATQGQVAALTHELETERLMALWTDRDLATVTAEGFPVLIERPAARFSAWYEFFPRSVLADGKTHGKFRDCLPRIEDARTMGFDVIYLPPIHPIGESHRKGRNNTVTCAPGDVGSPWAIGAKTGGHRSVEPQLGTIEDFEWLVKETKKRGMEIAIDFAINCSPDHPYVRDHPEWFFHRPDGTIKYAENPPKKYQDIYPLNFHCDDWQNLWSEMVSLVTFWVDRGVRIFRVDNPHTKPVAFWEYLIAEIRKSAPETLFLAEAFTRPRMMQALGKIGFSQSYTYFTWRETREELIEYATELTQGEMRDYYCANFWPNTPDILPHHLQHAPPAMFKIRATLAATLSTSWGIYSGYELCENQPLPGREEYLDSEKYQITERNWDKPGNIKAFIGRLNHIRREQPALQEYANLHFIEADNDRIIAYWKHSDDRQNIIVVVVNLDAHDTQESTIHLPLEEMGVDPHHGFAVEDLMFDEIYHWQGASNFVSLDPRSKPVHILKLLPS